MEKNVPRRLGVVIASKWFILKNISPEFMHRCDLLLFKPTDWKPTPQNCIFLKYPNMVQCTQISRWFSIRRHSVHTLHMSKPNVTRVLSATQWTASVHTLHMSKPNVTRVLSAPQWTASVHTLHMPKPNVTRVQSATQWTYIRTWQWRWEVGQTGDACMKATGTKLSQMAGL